MTQNRRNFFTTLGAVTAAIAGAGRGLNAQSLLQVLAPQKLDRVGIQLYTLRRLATSDLAGALGQLAKIGYKEIEFAGYYNHPAAEVRELLEQNGLTAPSAHIGIDLIEKEPAKTFADAKTVGHEWITVPSLPNGKRETTDDWKRVAEQFNKTAAQVKSAGFRFGYHNHNTELKKIGDVMPLDILISETDPALVSFEMDIYWVVNGGGSPLDLLARYPGRFKMLHVKDSMGPPDNKMADVGAGTIDFKTIFARAKGIEHYFVEHDQPADPIASAAASYRYLANLEF
ncbi:MAG: sugar phosphate isomerase/epimerase [bacterium]